MLGSRRCIWGVILASCFGAGENVTRTGPKKFAEPVSLSSTASADFRLPATAFGLGFDLLALRARRKWESNVSSKRIKGSKEVVAAICGFFLFQHFHSPSSNVWTRLWKPL